MNAVEKMICNWRVTSGVPSGLHVWFDPNCESVRLFRVPTGDQQSYLHEDSALDAGVGPGHLDKVGSVSASGQGQASGDPSRVENDPESEALDLPF